MSILPLTVVAVAFTVVICQLLGGELGHHFDRLISVVVFDDVLRVDVCSQDHIGFYAYTGIDHWDNAVSTTTTAPFVFTLPHLVLFYV